MTIGNSYEQRMAGVNPPSTLFDYPRYFSMMPGMSRTRPTLVFASMAVPAIVCKSANRPFRSFITARCWPSVWLSRPAATQGQVVNLVQSPSFEEHGTARIEPVG